MYRAIRRQGSAAFLRQETPALVAAFVIAELFYKWGSFALECLGFLATWFALSFLLAQLAPRATDDTGLSRPPGS